MDDGGESGCGSAADASNTLAHVQLKASGSLNGELRAERAAQAIADLADFDLHRHPHVDLLGRTWELRNNLTSYDAVYVALAKAIASPLVTCDGPLGATPGHRVRVEVIR